jgi:phosphonate ABC transporter permease subunit PhnE
VNKKRSLLSSIGLGVAVVVGLVIYAYGFQVTKVNFSETRSEKRLAVLSRILRALAHPDLITYDVEETIIGAPIYLPCPAGEFEIEAPDRSGPYLLTDVPCADAGAFISIEGYNFPPGAVGPVNFLAASGVQLQLANFTVEEDGSFKSTVKLPNRQPVEQAQHLQVTARVKIGAPKFTDTAKVTWDKIIETVFLALLATTVGTFLAIPVSFIAARNLMSQVKVPLASIALNLIGFPLGMGVGILANGYIRILTEMLSGGMAMNLASIAIGITLAFGISRWALPRIETEPPKTPLRIARLLALLAAALLGFQSMDLFGQFALVFGQTLILPLGSFGFLGYFISQIGDVIQMFTPMLTAIAGGAVLASALGRFGQQASDRLPDNKVKSINLIVSFLAGAALFVLLAAVINWFYQFENSSLAIWGPAITGGVLGLLLALRVEPKQAMPTGITIYFVVRTILNATRSVEPLVMVIVFVAWVGIGPFAGALALALHTIAALAKLYSEQVESILPGPLEAIQATGANRLQTIIYGVVPQIVPPYISFTMYRWDINVRMSTIIGFAGGGGIGFLLQQNINLLNYRAASMQMLAIAIVVASMDYISSTLRERFV